MYEITLVVDDTRSSLKFSIQPIAAGMNSLSLSLRSLWYLFLLVANDACLSFQRIIDRCLTRFQIPSSLLLRTCLTIMVVEHVLNPLDILFIHFYCFTATSFDSFMTRIVFSTLDYVIDGPSLNFFRLQNDLVRIFCH